MRSKLVMAAVLAGLTVAHTVRGAVVTDTISIGASFIPRSNTPQDYTLSGEYTLTFDPTVDVTDATSGLVVDSVMSPDFASISTGYTVGTDVDMHQYLTIGGLDSSVALVEHDTLDYLLTVGDIDTATPTFEYAAISRPGFESLNQSDFGAATVTPVIAPTPPVGVPEPTTATAVVLLASAALASRRRRQVL